MRRRRSRPAARAAAWELRSFLGASAAIALAFALALVYLGASTDVATTGYALQRLEARRDELGRQNALLELELAKLASPGRIDAEARRLGLVRVPFVPVMGAEPVAAQR